MAGFGTGISVGGSGIDAAGFGDGACSRQYRFEKGGFTALERAHQRNAPWTSGTSDVLSHMPPPSILKSARDWVGGSNAPPVPRFWQAGKCRRKITPFRMQCSVRCAALPPAKGALTTGAQFQALQPGGNGDADLALHAERLQRERIVGAADQHIAADAGADRGAALR